ncbi:MAG: hypothetical protein K2G69_04485 [Muribaculaceae bacterium]|nr:hypothetical protein [Muribaculaceae bacterium]
MNLKNIIKSTIMAGLLLTAGGCHDDIFDADGRWNGNIPDEFTVNLVVPDPQVVNIGGTRSSDVDITSLNVLLYKDGDVLIENRELDADEFNYDPDTNIGSAKIHLTKDTKRIQIVANAATEMDGKSDPSKVVITDASKMILWGQASISNALQKGTIPLLRPTAKLTVKLGAGVSNFEVQEIGVFGAADKGTVGPDLNSNYDETTGLTTTATTAAGTTYLKDDDFMQTWAPTDGAFTMTGFFETPGNIGTESNKDFVRVIIKGKYTDADGSSIDGYYVVALSERGVDESKPGFSETEGHFTYGDILDILRNHEYKITIQEVRSEGWPKLEQAKTALPDNRATILVEDKSPLITDIEASRDYYLGVGADVTSNYNDEYAVIDVATTYPGLVANATWADKLEFESDEEWIILEEDAAAAKHITYEENGASQVKVKIPLITNTDSRNRYGYIKVRTGKLSRTVRVSQSGCPYNRRRVVTVSGIPGLDVSTDGYYSFLDGVKYDEDGNSTGVAVAEYIKGIQKEQNRGADRIGLHFPIVPLYGPVKYTIPKKDADTEAKISLGADVFTVSEDASNWYVELADPSVIKSGEGRLSISSSFNGTPVTVEYKLYRTGIFHQLKTDMTQYQPADAAVQKTGWYYYELVKIGNVYMLDRDLGAESNLPYSPGSSDYKKNTSAIGGYFKANTARWADCTANANKDRREDQQTITNSLGLASADGKFVMAREEDLLAINPNCGTVVEAATTGGRIAEGKIYFSKAGYYEGSEFKDPMRCKIWTRTYLGGTQGMAVTSPEYGYWYRYFDDMKSTNPENRYSNIRIARGSNGNVPTSASVWRYMPLRLVWVDSSCNNPGGSQVAEEEDIVRGKMVIYFQDNVGWSQVKYHAWGVSSGTTTWGWDNLPAAPKVAGKNGLYRVEVGIPTVDDAGILFKYGADQNNQQTYEIRLKSYYDDGCTVLLFTQDGNETNNKYKVKELNSGNVESIGTGEVVTPPTPTTTYTYGLKLGGETVSLTNNVLTDKVLTNASTTIEVIEYAKTGSNTTPTYYNNKFNAPGLDKDVNFTTGNSSWSLEAGTYTFTLNPTAKTLKVVKKTTPVPTGETTYRIFWPKNQINGKDCWKIKITNSSTGAVIQDWVGAGDGPEGNWDFSYNNATYFYLECTTDAPGLKFEFTNDNGDKVVADPDKAYTKSDCISISGKDNYIYIKAIKLDGSATADNATYSLRSNFNNGNWETKEMTKSGTEWTITVAATGNFNFLFYKNESGKDQVEIKSDWDNTTVNLSEWMSSSETSGSNWWVDKGSGTYTIKYRPSDGKAWISK